VLRKAGEHSAMLMALSASVQLDAFTKVKKAIDDMVAGLKKEQADEVKHKDFCDAELAQNARDTQATERQLTELNALIADSEASISALTKDIASLQAANKEMAKQVQQASEDRELENKEFQQAVSEHRQTQAILQKALARLESFYSSLLQSEQEPGAAVEPMPEGFGEYKKSGGASGVMQLLKNIIGEAKAMENDALKAETDSQASYEEFIKNTNDSTATNNKAIVAKTEEKAETEATKVAAEGDKVAAEDDAEKNAAMNAQLHGSCDFLLKNFDLRQSARTEEMEALAQAKAILSGADFGF